MPRVTRLARGVKRPRTDKDQDGPRVDARSERWREHRVQVRNELVEAAIRALDKIGPEVTMDDIAREAGAAKPKLYRHFSDKLDLYSAIVENVQGLLWGRIMASINLLADPAGELVTRSAAEYALVVTEHPNVFRFLVHSHFTRQADESERAIAAAQDSARRIAAMFAEAMGEQNVDIESTELVTFAIFGTVASATDWWLGANRMVGHPMPVEEFVRYLSALIEGMIGATARISGIVIDPQQPLHAAFAAKE
ncbi:TetR/AcrR family transcriptional regulator [Nocardiaceae bacterium YC2-7]|uniref:TetR/AcrR family transcriptional regulator n=1 Tax=Antrihabitans stalactiti TaxID=2584121 RepID=A0A848KQX1_9NOCA|nr:TetR/AcrR family transcriptional regulator [Antrihabitans stalactiti]